LRVPASAANLGPGFDALSIAIEEPCITVTLELLDGEPRVEVEAVGTYASRVPTSPELNAAGRVLKSLLKRAGVQARLRIRIGAEIPVAKGLGSSGAEAAGAVVGGEAILGLRLSESEKIRIASTVEPGGHADNVISSLLGGFNIIDNSQEPPNYLNMRPPSELGLVVIVPRHEKTSTEHARKALTRHPTIREYSLAISRASLLAAAMALGKTDLVLRTLPLDPYIEKERAEAGLYGEGYTWEKLLEDKKRLLVDYGVALCISGSGPSRLLVYDERVGLERIEHAVEYLTGRIEKMAGGVERVYYTRPSLVGAEVLEQP